jgi:hypothetical protein
MYIYPLSGIHNTSLVMLTLDQINVSEEKKNGGRTTSFAV